MYETKIRLEFEFIRPLSHYLSAKLIKLWTHFSDDCLKFLILNCLSVSTLFLWKFPFCFLYSLCTFINKCNHVKHIKL